MSGDGERIDQQSQQNAKDLMRSLERVLSDFMDWMKAEKGEWASLFSGKDGGKELRIGENSLIRFNGGSPSKDPANEVLRMDFTNGRKVYFGRGANGGAELVFPKMPVNYIPEMVGAILASLQQGKLQDGVKFHHKPSGWGGYTPILMERQPRVSLANPPLPKTDLDRLVKVWENLYKCLGEISAIVDSQKETNSQKAATAGGQSKPNRFWENLGQLCGNIRNSAKHIGENLVKQLKGENPQNLALARELYTLATKLDNPKSPGQLRGNSYSIVTQGPGQVSIRGRNSKELFGIRQKDPWGKPEIIVADGVSLKELAVILTRLALINERMGNMGLTEFIKTTPPSEVPHIFEAFTPPNTLKSVVGVQADNEADHAQSEEPTPPHPEADRGAPAEPVAYQSPDLEPGD